MALRKKAITEPARSAENWNNFNDSNAISMRSAIFWGEVSIAASNQAWTTSSVSSSMEQEFSISPRMRRDYSKIGSMQFLIDAATIFLAESRDLFTSWTLYLYAAYFVSKLMSSG